MQRCRPFHDAAWEPTCFVTWVSRVCGFQGCVGFKGVWVSRVYGFQGCVGFKGVWVSRVYGFQGCMGF